MIEFKFSGLDQALERLRTLPMKVEKKIMRRVLRKAAKPMQKMAKDKIPKDTGDLARSIKVRAKKRSRNEFGVRVGTATGKGETMSGRDLEFGHRIGKRTTITLGKGKNKKTIGTDTRESVQPRPFMRPTFDSLKAATMEAIGVELGRLVEEEASGKDGGEGEAFENPNATKTRKTRQKKPKTAI